MTPPLVDPYDRRRVVGSWAQASPSTGDARPQHVAKSAVLHPDTVLRPRPLERVQADPYALRAFLSRGPDCRDVALLAGPAGVVARCRVPGPPGSGMYRRRSVKPGPRGLLGARAAPMSSLKRWAWHKTGRAVLWALLKLPVTANSEDWRVMWADRTAAAAVARAATTDWWRGDAARHIRACRRGRSWPRWVGDTSPGSNTSGDTSPGPGLPGWRNHCAANGSRGCGYRRADGTGNQEAGEKVLLALRDLADKDAEAWWAWEPAARGGECRPGAAGLVVCGAGGGRRRGRPRACRSRARRADAPAARGHGDIAVLQGMKVWTRQADGVRKLAQQRRDLITESATAAATSLHRATLQRATPQGQTVLSDWWRRRPPAPVSGATKRAVAAHLAELADPATAKGWADTGVPG